MRLLVLALVMPLIAAAPLKAQYSEQQLLDAYLNEDMTVWKNYVDASDRRNIPTDEHLRLLRYEYGLAAAMLSSDKDKAKTYIQLFGEHIQQAQPVLSQALYNVYMSAYHSYSMRLTMNVFAHAKAVKQHATAAIQADPDEPMAWIAMANIHFYAPGLMGGDKQKALQEYDRADSLFIHMPDSANTRWERYAERMNRQKCKNILQSKH